MSKFDFRRLIVFSMAFLFLSTSSMAKATEVEGIDKKLSPYTLSYVVSFPTASTARFLNNSVSYRGIGFDFNAPIESTNLYWGVSFRWLYFTHDEDQGTYSSGNTTVTGRIYRSVDSFPLTLDVKYAFASTSDRVLPFVGLGVGTIYGRRELEIGAYSQNAFGWQFLMAPEAGALFTVSPTSPVKLFFNVRYDAGFGSDAIGAISNLSLAIGIGSKL